MTPLLRAEAVTKRFPGVTALDRVSFDLFPGEVHALCGENGAGKSTLIKLLSGLHPHGGYEGRLFIDGNEAAFASTAAAEAAGLAVIYQELALVPAMSVAENLFLGDEPTAGGLLDRGRMLRETRQILGRFGLDVDPSSPTERLGVGQRQLVEIAKALRKEPRILILDEPTAALSEAETGALLDTVRGLRARGIACVYISHRLDEVFALADRITVLRDGTTVATLSAAEASPALVIGHMVGREIRELYPRRPSAAGRTLLRVKGLSAAGRPDEPALSEVSLDLREGEVLGVGGLMGAGRSELLMHLFGAWGRRIGGVVELAGRVLPPGDPVASLRAGLALVTEDRRRYGLFLDRSVGFNLSLSALDRLSRAGLVDATRETCANREMLSALRVRAAGLDAAAGGLSGGNQQKVVIGKALMTGPRVVLLDEPTRGIDVGAKQEVYALINRLTAEGRAVLLVSSELPELMGLSDRVLMLHEGAPAGLFARGAPAEKLMAAALGHSACP